MDYAKVKGKNVVITLPIDLLEVAFNNNPNNWDESIKVKFKRQFAKGFAEKINETSTNSETGLTVFQEAIDEIFDEMLEEAPNYIKVPQEDY
ncbi:hypothetical protein ABE320_16885 [Bacillus velezensis]|uniref:hypothetical protein n=2 Tax=Bacillaceae TaxID=186817 RepID=UPI00224CB145|nr:hypothetical protein [Bacillus amyloliquefaciens]MCX4184192.1 hypothetical protein [Bacillus amyloliquefaciens]